MKSLASNGWVTLGSIIIALVGAGAGIWAAASSADSAESSRVSAVASRDMPYRSALFEQRTTALRTYTQAHGQFSASLRTAALALKLGQAGGDERVLREQRALASEVSSRLLDQYYAYTTEVNTSRAVWEGDVDAQVIAAGDLARQPWYCFTSLNDRVQGLPPEEQLHVQAGVGDPCRDLHAKIRAFDSASNLVISTMVQQVEGSWSAKAPD